MSLSAYLSDQWGTDTELKGQRYSDGSILDFRFVNKKPTATPDTLEDTTLVPMGWLCRFSLHLLGHPGNLRLIPGSHVKGEEKPTPQSCCLTSPCGP